MISDKAVIEKSAKIGAGVKIEEFVRIEPNAVIGDDVLIRQGAVIGRNAVIGQGTKIFPYAVIGTEPQDLKYRGEETLCEIGKNCIIREFTTVNRGTIATGKTVVGDNVLLMAYVHIAHDCRVGENSILANCATLAGHVTVENNVIVGGLTPIHQFVKIGSYAMLGGASRISQDVPPYSIVAGNPAYLYGLNLIGLKRAGFTAEKISILKKAFKIIFRSGMNKEEALNEALKLEKIPELEKLIDFVKNSERGITPSRTAGKNGDGEY